MADDISLIVGVDYSELTGLVKTTGQTKRALGSMAREFANSGSQKSYMAGINKLVAAQRNLDKSARMSRSEIMKLGNQMKQEAKFSNALSQATVGLSQSQMAATKSSNRMGVVTQQAGYQVGDFLVQVQSGTNVMVAFGQQATQLVGILPLMTGAFGLSTTALIGISAALGIAIPLMTAIGAAFLRSSGKAKTLTQSIGELESATQSFTNLVETYTLDGLLSLEKKYKDVNGEVLRLVENQKFLVQAELNKSLKDTVRLIGDITGARWYDIGISDYASSILNLKETFKATKADAEVLYAAFQDISKAEVGSLEQADALAKVAGHMRTLISTSDEVTDKQLELLQSVLDTEDAIRQMAGAAPEANWMNAAKEGVNSLYDSVVQALGKVIALKAEANAVGPKRPMARPTDIDFGYTPDPAGRTRPRGRSLDFMAPPKTRGGSGGGAKSPAEELQGYLDKLQQQADLENQLVGIFGEKRNTEEEVIKARQKYGEVFGATQEAELRGTLAQIEADKERQRVLEEARAQQEEVASVIADNFGSAFMSIVDGTKTAKEAFKDMARAIIKQLFQILVVEKMVNSIKGFISPSVSASQANGGAWQGGSQIKAYADGGVVGGPTFFPMAGGKTGLMGEAGPEAIMPLKRGANGKLGVQMEGNAGGDVNIVQNFSFAANGDDSVKKLIAQAAPQIANMTQKQIMDSRRRGGAMKSTFG